MADIVLPVAYAPKGSPLARRLWQYKSVPPSGHGSPDRHPLAYATRARQAEQAAAAALLLALLLTFLLDHGACMWRLAELEPPTHVAVVPTARGRPGEHPLRSLIAPYLSWPWADLRTRPDQRERDLDPRRFDATPIAGSRVLLIDDTWTTGASAQSAAMALRGAGARSVAAVVIGRHISGDAATLGRFGPAVMPYRSGSCGVHQDQRGVI
jgi:hypothetical protein